MSSIDLVPLVDEGLGNTSYLLDLGDGRALAVDVSRDLRRLRTLSDERGLRIAFAAETHLHADFLSGACALAAHEGALPLGSADADRAYPHASLRDGDEVDLGGLRMQVLATPGHTHEHLSYLLLDGDIPLGVFTGGSLLVGAAARSDLVSPEQTDALARAQYASLRRLARLPDDVAVWPTHGAGSFCTTPASPRRTSTVGDEKATNPLLNLPDEDTFVAATTSSVGSFPPYFLRLPELNRLGPALLEHDPTLTGLTVDETRTLIADGALVVDVRPVAAFAAGHIPGALSIPLRPVFASWLGWLAPPDRPLITVRGAEQDSDEIVWQAIKIGYDNLVGELSGGVEAWASAGQPVANTRLVGPDALANRRVLDVRQHAEFAAGHVPGAVHVELGDLLARAGELSSDPTVVMCGHGERAMSGASLLERAGHPGLAVLDGGPDGWARATGTGLTTGS